MKNITMKWPSQKLNWQCYEPFWIVKQIRKVAYQLNLLKKLCIHDVFHVSLLHDYKSHAEKDISESEILHLAKNSEMKKWEVKIIIDSWVINELKNKPVLQYWIVWKGFSEIIWEPAENVKNAKKLIKKFYQNFSEALQVIINVSICLQPARAKS